MENSNFKNYNSVRIGPGFLKRFLLPLLGYDAASHVAVPLGFFPVNSAFPAILMPTVTPAPEPLLLSVVIPVYNEADNVLPLLAEIRAALARSRRS